MKIGVIVAAITSNQRLAAAPGNVALAGTAGLTMPSVVNVSQVLTIDRALLGQRIGRLGRELPVEVERGLRFVLSL